jgi:hypothetical protein
MGRSCPPECFKWELWLSFSTRSTPALRRPMSCVVNFMLFLFLKFYFHYKCLILYKSKKGKNLTHSRNGVKAIYFVFKPTLNLAKLLPFLIHWCSIYFFLPILVRVRLLGTISRFSLSVSRLFLIWQYKKLYLPLWVICYCFLLPSCFFLRSIT